MPLQWCLGLAILSLPFVDFEVFQLAGKSIVLPYVAAGLLVIPLLPRLETALSHLRQDPALPWLLAWLAAACLTAAAVFFWYQRAEVFDRNVTQLLNLVMMVGQYALFLAALRATPPAALRSLVRLLVWVGAAAAAYSLYQVASVYLGAPAPDVLRTSNLYHKLNTLSPTGAGGWAGVPRAFGVAPEPSFWGGYLAFSAAFVLGGMGRRARLVDVGILLLISAAILVTFSRGAWLTFAALGGLWAAGRVTSRVSIGVLALFALVLCATALPLFAAGEQVSGFTDLSAVGRLASQQTAWRIFFDHPVLGIGFGSAEFFVQQYNEVFPSVSTFGLEHVYNFYLLVLVSTGLLGFALFTGFLLTVIRRLDPGARPRAGQILRPVRLSAALALASCLGLWLNTPAYNFTFIWFALALASALPSITGEAERRDSHLEPGAACVSLST